jgi:pantothenate kinase-related protein Tda10
MAKQNIEKILEGVRSVEAHDAEAGLAIRRVVEKAEDLWNEHPHNLDTNKENVVVKRFDADDLRAAADVAGLAANVNVKAFIAVVDGWPSPPEPTAEELAKAAEDAETIAHEQASAEKAADDLMTKAFSAE